MTAAKTLTKAIDRPWLLFACLALLYVDVIAAWQQPAVRQHVVSWIAPAPASVLKMGAVVAFPMHSWFESDLKFLKTAPSNGYNPVEEWTRERCGNPCDVKPSMGGYLGEYIVAAKAIKARGDTMRVGSFCFSACGMAAVWLRENGGNVCVTDTAVIGFHLGHLATVGTDGKPFDAAVSYEFPADMMAWQWQHGGLNNFQMLGLHAPDIYKFFKACP